MRLLEHHSVIVVLKQVIERIDKLSERIDFLSDRIDAWEAQDDDYYASLSDEASGSEVSSVQSAPASFSY